MIIYRVVKLDLGYREHHYYSSELFVIPH